MPSTNEFMIAEAALQTEFQRRKIVPPDLEDDLSVLTEGYLADLFFDKPELKKKRTPIRSTFLQKMREDAMPRTIQNIYIGTNGARSEDESEEEEETEETPAAEVDENEKAAQGERAVTISYEQRMKNVATAVRRYGIVEGSDYWPIATYENHVIASDWYTGKFYRFDYSVTDNQIKLSEPSEVMETFVDVSEAAKSAPFQMLRQRDGKFRWLAISSNTYKDAYKENFSKESLEEAVTAMQKSGDHGELRLEHVLTSRVGTCDFSKVLGNFLVESGTFDTTPRAKKVVETLQGDAEAKWRVSIGFFYNPKYLVDGEYKSHVRIHERSITQIPANTITAISLAELGGSMETADTKARLMSVLGGDEDLVESIITDLKNTVVPTALGRKDAEAGIVASGVRKDDEAKEEEEEGDLPAELEVELEDGRVVRVARTDLLEKAEVGITRAEVREMLRELVQTEILPAVIAETRKEANSELPRAAKYRFTQEVRAGTKKEREEDKELIEAGLAAREGTPAGFWARFPGGKPS